MAAQKNRNTGIIGRWENGPKVMLLVNGDNGYVVLVSNSGAAKTFKPVRFSDDSVLEGAKTNKPDEAHARVEQYVTARGWLTPDQAALARAEADNL